MRSGSQTTAWKEGGTITERPLTITNKVGLHARPAALFVQTAARFKDTKIEIVKDGTVRDAKSMLGVLTLGVSQGTTIMVRADGPHAEEAIAALSDLVDRDFTASGPDELWIADFTQIATWQGVAYIAVVADAYSRLCLGWRVRPDKTTDLVLEALEMAIWRRGQMRAAGAIHHTDQGSQGGFKWWSQLLVMGVVRDGYWRASAGDSSDARAVVVAGAAVGGAAGGSAAVLAGDRSRRVERGCGGRG